MAPTKQTKNGRKVKQPNNKRQRRIPKGLGLDRAATEYVRLLTDPCNAPLVHPTYTGGDSGYLVRCDKVFIVGRGSGITAGLIQWTPGDINDDATEFLSAAGSDFSSGFPAVPFADASPGRNFLSSNASAYRCVAACAKFTYPGSESGRAGWVHYGHGNGRSIILGSNYAASGVGRLCNNYSRTPVDTVAVVWRPDFADPQMVDPTATRQQRAGTGSILFAFGGFPPDAGIVVSMTAVYEWVPRGESDGPANPIADKNESSNTLDQVFAAIRRAGFNWVRDSAHLVGSGLTTGMVAGLANTFGMMPSVSRARSQRNLTY